MDENKINGNLPEENSGGDEYIIGKGFVPQTEENYAEAPRKRQKKSRKKGKGTVKNILWIVSIVVVSLCISAGVIFAAFDYLGIWPGGAKNCVVEIEPGSSTAKIAEKMGESGAIKWPFLFRVYSKVKGFESQYKYGVYTFDSELGYEGLAEMLVTDGAKADSVKVVIPEMSSVDDIAKILEENGVCKRADFITVVQQGEFNYNFMKGIPDKSVYYRLEGYLFPDTYDFYCYDSEECAYLAVDKMLKTLDEKLRAEGVYSHKSDYTLHEIMTMASIIELEAGGSPEEMPKVSAVFYNRLESPDFATLGSSPTRKYPHGNGRYNTYECNGLPPGPLCSPSIKSVMASVYPQEDFNYYYFVTDASMKFYYNETLTQHNNIIAKLKAEKNWIYEEW